MSSTRLPGKVLMLLNGKVVLEHVLERAQMIEGVDEVVLAVPQREDTTLLKAVARKLDVRTVEGPLENVLERYAIAAVKSKADVIVRITSDCPLLDPVVSSAVVKLRRQNGAKYASNVHPRSWPKGLDTEVFTSAALVEAYRDATDQHDREHVTPYIVRNSPRLNYPSHRFDLSEIRWTLDTPEDLRHLRALCDGRVDAMSWVDNLQREWSLNDAA